MFAFGCSLEYVSSYSASNVRRELFAAPNPLGRRALSPNQGGIAPIPIPRIVVAFASNF